MASASEVEFISKGQEEADALSIVIDGAEIFIPLAEIIDIEKELERLKDLKRIKSGDRVNYFMVDNDDRVREVAFKFPATKVIMNLAEYGVSGDGRLYLDLTKAIEVLEQNEALADNPELVNQDPYGKGWLVKIKPNDANDINDLMDAEAYKALVNE